MKDYSQLIEKLAIEKRAYCFGSPSDQEIGVEQLASMAVNHIPALVEEVLELRAASLAPLVEGSAGERAKLVDELKWPIGVAMAEAKGKKFDAGAAALSKLMALALSATTPVEGDVAGRWVSVKERLPLPDKGYTEYSRWVWAYTMGGLQIEASYYYKKGLIGWHTKTGTAQVTHWRELPAAPLAVKEEGHA